VLQDEVTKVPVLTWPLDSSIGIPSMSSPLSSSGTPSRSGSSSGSPSMSGSSSSGSGSPSISSSLG
jgi:hypothetical protein